MESDLAKVLHRAAGRPLVLWMLDVLAPLEIDRTIVVVGHQAEQVRAVLPPGVDSALQTEQLGTGHAVMAALDGVDLVRGDRVLVVPGDMPLIRTESLHDLIAHHERVGSAATILTVVLDEPDRYGRIIRNGEGAVRGIVEARDASPAELQVREVNTSVYVFDGPLLSAALRELRPDNDQGELYLTDVIGIVSQRGSTVAAVPAADAEEGRGVNTVAELEAVGAHLAARRRGPL
jgi:UDP-N-acetylglucosamine diphosphorylase/glucosamine-1-phosphate N-acetyltransferase